LAPFKNLISGPKDTLLVLKVTVLKRIELSVTLNNSKPSFNSKLALETLFFADAALSAVFISKRHT
jgi:ABC-type oligopeptide transport system substrate-binding subunit